MTQINITVEEALHKALRKKAIDEGNSMSKVVNRLIEMYVKGKDKAEWKKEEESEGSL